MNAPFNAAAEQPTPHGSGTPIVDLVKQDLETRAQAGQLKYGERLKAHNGRNAGDHCPSHANPATLAAATAPTAAYPKARATKNPVTTCRERGPAQARITAALGTPHIAAQ